MGFCSIILAGQDGLGQNIIKGEKHHMENERHQYHQEKRFTESQILLSYIIHSIIQALVRTKYNFLWLKIWIAKPTDTWEIYEIQSLRNFCLLHKSTCLKQHFANKRLRSARRKMYEEVHRSQTTVQLVQFSCWELWEMPPSTLRVS